MIRKPLFLLFLVLSSTTFASPSAFADSKPKYGSDATPLSVSNEYFRTKESASSLFWKMIPYYSPQQTGSSCSLATVTLIVNAARAGKKLSAEDPLASETKVTEKVKDDVWNKAVGKGGHGVALDDLGGLLEKSLNAYEIKPIKLETVHATKENKARIHQILVEMEKNPKGMILANFLQGEYTGDAPAGHISPVGAYDSKNKRVLILDTDREWYEPYWISEEVFFKGMATLDAGKPRGLVWVEVP